MLFRRAFRISGAGRWILTNSAGKRHSQAAAGALPCCGKKDPATHSLDPKAAWCADRTWAACIHHWVRQKLSHRRITQRIRSVRNTSQAEVAVLYVHKELASSKHLKLFLAGCHREHSRGQEKSLHACRKAPRLSGLWEFRGVDLGGWQ